MVQQLPVIIIIAPLVASFFIFFSGWWSKKMAFPLAVAAMSICLLSSIIVVKSVIDHGVISYWLGGWRPPWGIEYRIDHLNALMLVLVSGLSLLATVQAKKSVEKELPGKITLFWSLFVLMITGLLGICITGDLFNLFVLLEVTSLSGYALIAMGERNAVYASFRYVIIGTMGASFYLLGVGYLYISSGSLNIADLSQILPKLYHSRSVIVGFVFIVTGLGIKMALFPLHGWLPDAYTYAPSAVSATVAPLMTKVMAYVTVRVMFNVFRAEFSISMLTLNDIMVWLGVFSIIFGGVMALSQKDYKRMLSYVIIAEIGYIIGGIGVANATAIKGAIFHIVNDAMIVACLFAVSTLVMYQYNGHRIEDFRGIFKTMPGTAFIFTIGALAVIGVPPTCGFFSKWYLLLGGIESNQWAFVAALLVSTLINIALFFRIFDKGLYVHAQKNDALGRRPFDATSIAEAPLSMLIPAILLALAIFLAGIFNQTILNKLIHFAVPVGL